MFGHTNDSTLIEFACALEDVLKQAEEMCQVGDFDNDLHVTLSEIQIRAERELDRRNQHRIDEHHRLMFRRWKRALP